MHAAIGSKLSSDARDEKFMTVSGESGKKDVIIEEMARQMEFQSKLESLDKAQHPRLSKYSTSARLLRPFKAVLAQLRCP